ncbi:hypothetical protein NE237_005216 [Protea cynaroides]|uniref:Exostosin GT47 domain-containing protein n=1 Tax=Protea cynaroides TaxID=273540 RepID=A0A9Q0QUD5_9MAGN|nr:hypothetical protein NE237_005216 [Protea cynaroides]
MKLSHYQGRHDKSFCYRYFRWVIWFSLSLYFFSSYLISNSSRTTPLRKTTISTSLSSFVYRALLEANTIVLGLKIYVYDLPPQYNKDSLTNERCRRRTLNPWEADFFFVLVYISCNFSTENGFSAIATQLTIISTEMPFWNRGHGSDHGFVASHDYEACFHAMEDVAIADGIPEFLKKSIILQTFGRRYRHACPEVENILIPPYVSLDTVRSTLTRTQESSKKRDIWVFFRGKMAVWEFHPQTLAFKAVVWSCEARVIEFEGAISRSHIYRRLSFPPLDGCCPEDDHFSPQTSWWCPLLVSTMWFRIHTLLLMIRPSIPSVVKM